MWVACLALGFVVALFWLNPSTQVMLKKDYWLALSQFEESLRIVHSEYVDGNKSSLSNLSSLALSGMIGSLDRHSKYFTPRQYENFNDDTHRVYVGIGIMIRKKEDGVMVSRVFQDSPAETAGLKVGDFIIEVDAKPIKDVDLDQISARIRGVAGTTVKLLVGDARNANKLYEVQRGKIKIASLRSHWIDQNGTVYLQLEQFTERTGEEVKERLHALGKERIKGIILDLRDNSGGLLKGAIEVASLFLAENQRIVSVSGRHEREQRVFDCLQKGDFMDVPLVVLINEGSASASEIVAGSLSRSKGALLVGETSFGKGSVQTIYPLKDGSGMKLTTAMYFFADGTTIHEKGIEPDHHIANSDEEKSKLRLQRNAVDLGDDDEFREIFGFDRIDDSQLKFAQDLILIAQRESE